MSTSPTRTALRRHDASPVPERLHSRLLGVTLAVIAFAVAFCIDLASGQQYSQVLGSAALLTSLFAIVPTTRRVAWPVGAYIAVWGAFNGLRALGDEVPWSARTRDWVANLERAIAGGEPPGVTFQRWLGESGVLACIAAVVYLSYFVVPHLVGIVLLVRDRTRFQWYLGATAVLFALGAVAFALLPTAPPWMVTDGPDRVVHGLFGGEGDAGYGFEPNPIASMPSIHMGITVMLAIIARGRWRSPAIAYASAMGVSLIFLGEHHVLDVLAGALIAWAACRIWTTPTARETVDNGMVGP